MQLADLINNIDEIKPNQYGKEIKTLWLNEIEAKVAREIVNCYNKEYNFENYDYDLHNEKVLILPDEFCDVYASYICAKIDFYNAEYERYNNFAMLHNQAFEEAAKYYRRKYTPRQDNNLNPF